MISLLTLAACVHSVVPDIAVTAPAPGEFPHALLEQVLAAHVDVNGKVDYKSIQSDRTTLDTYVAYLAAVSPEHDPALFPTRNDALTYYINGYNALAITGVIDRPKLKSVIDDKLGFFVTTTYTMGARKLSLYTLENKVVRAQFNDPRVHFALNCQSGGCPRLPQHAFTVAGLDAELDAASHEFATTPSKVNVEGGVVHLSQICEWYAEDFAAAGGAVAFLNTQGAGLPTDAKVEFIPYDWALSTQDGRGP